MCGVFQGGSEHDTVGLRSRLVGNFDRPDSPGCFPLFSAVYFFLRETKKNLRRGYWVCSNCLLCLLNQMFYLLTVQVSIIYYVVVLLAIPVL